MIDLDVTALVQFFNFIISLVVLNYLLVKPIRDIIKKRSDNISGLVDEAEKFNKSAEEKMKNYEAALVEARKAGTEERIAMKDQATAEEKALIEAATGEAQQKLAAAKSEIKSQMDTALSGLKGQVDSFAEKAAAKVLG